MEAQQTVLSFIKKDAFFLFFGIFLLIGISWFSLFSIFSAMNAASMDSMMQTSPWEFTAVLITFAMWLAMMAAMMLPSAIPMISLFSNVYKKRAEQKKAQVPSWIFLFGYLFIWALFSIVAALLQTLLKYFNILSPNLAIINTHLSGILLVGMGAYQFTSIKKQCLSHCQSPIDFLSSHWMEGKKGALQMGIHHGIYCLGCCWALMALLFVVGIMNIVWIAVLTGIVFAEKSFKKQWTTKVTGIILVSMGIWILM